jgi:hypothetical protein
MPFELVIAWIVWSAAAAWLLVMLVRDGRELARRRKAAQTANPKPTGAIARRKLFAPRRPVVPPIDEERRRRAKEASERMIAGLARREKVPRLPAPVDDAPPDHAPATRSPPEMRRLPEVNH